jgi:hypothetical protein
MLKRGTVCFLSNSRWIISCLAVLLRHDKGEKETPEMDKKNKIPAGM